jgi:glutamate 5-kinase
MDIPRTRSRIVIKIGTNILADRTQGINLERIDSIARAVSSWHAQASQVAVVSSGAIGAGVAALQLRERPRTIPEKQATAAVGQPLLMVAYENAFRKLGCPIGQMLLTKDDFANRARYVNAKNTFAALFERGVVPIVNENDSVAVEEIRLGDNDNLSALVATLIEADLLVILTDRDGLYSDDPSTNSRASLIPLVENITPQIEKLAKNTKSELGTGGMTTKVQAARRCVSAGIAVIIANGKKPNTLDELVRGRQTGTLFLPSQKKLNRRKQWIGFVSTSRGFLVVDDGARNALVRKHMSLLPSGILEIHGEFNANDTIAVRDASGKDIARGVTHFSSSDLARIKGKKSSDIGSILSRKSHDEVIHCDNLVLIGEE